ncbi:MAG TPA: signal peptidase II [Gemmatimonadales bacterium]
MIGGARRSSFWWILVGVVVLDYATKLLAVAGLSRVPVPVLGDWLSLRLVYNPGAAFGIYLGAYSRWIFTALALIALVVLGEMVRKTKPGEHFRLVALALVCGGAVGNLVDRFRSARGVVDFIDVWIGSFHWPTFNVADMAVSCGAIALAVVLWNEGRHDESAVAEQADVAEVSP